MEVGGSPDFTWYGKDASLNTYCGTVARLVPRLSGRALAVSGVNEVRADKAESLCGCGALFRHLIRALRARTNDPPGV